MCFYRTMWCLFVNLIIYIFFNFCDYSTILTFVFCPFQTFSTVLIIYLPLKKKKKTWKPFCIKLIWCFKLAKGFLLQLLHARELFQSTGSFFDITLGSLVGVSSILELSRSRRSTRGRRAEENVRDRRNNKPWLFSLCSKQSTDAVNARNTSSLDNFLEAERRSCATASHIYRRRIQSPTSVTISDAANSLIVDGGQVAAPPQSSAPNLGENGGRQSNNFLHGNGCGRMGFYYYSRIRACLDTP